MSNIVTIKGYHGTDYSGEKSILRSKIYKISNRDNEWLGSGAYFFIDSFEEKAKKNAEKWAVNYKKFKFWAVLETTIKFDKDEVIDLNDPDWQDLYHKYRAAKIEDTTRRGISLEANKLKFDCQTINDMCESLQKKGVYQQRYINLYKDRKTTNSEIPNCMIMCVRKNEIIDRKSIKPIKRGRING